MRLPKYLMGNNKNNMVGSVVICTDEPFIIGKVWTFTNEDAYGKYQANNDSYAIPGYRIVIEPVRTLVPHSLHPAAVELELERMGRFYLSEKKPGFLRRFQIERV